MSEEEIPNLFRLYLAHQDKEAYRIRLYAMMDVEHPDNFVAFQDMLTRATEMAYWQLNKAETEFTFRIEQPYKEKKFSRTVVGVVRTSYHPRADLMEQVVIETLDLDASIFGGIMESFKVLLRKGLIEKPRGIHPPKYGGVKDFPVVDLPEWPDYQKPVYQKYGTRSREVSYERPTRQVYQMEEVPLTVEEE